MPRRPRMLRSPAAQGLAAWLLAGLVVAPPGLPAAQAGPKGEKVVHGDASFARDGDLTVIRPSDGAIIDYTGFDILRQETVRFEQPSERARVLNRISGDATRIDGALTANGIVYLVNPAGIFFGGDAVVRVGRLVAAAGELPDRDFLAGADAFSLTGPVENLGSLEASAVSLLGRSVANGGSIVAPDGVIALVAGEKVVLTELEGGIAVEVEGPASGAGTGIAQSGLVDAGAGSASFAVGDHYSLAINHSGVTRARDILLAGGADGLVRVAGVLDASAREPGATGGSVRVTGDLVSLEGALLDASGAAGGGLLRVGGDPRGEGPLANARRTFVDQDSVLRADALEVGDGGSAVIFAEEAAGFLGRVSARGGAAGGDGGYAELSSGGLLVDEGSVDLRAPAGGAGTLLYDPRDIVLVGGTLDGSDTPDTSSGAVVQGTTAGQVLFADVGDADPFAVYESELEGTDANIVLEARNSITASGTFDHDAGGEGVGVVAIRSGNDLTLRTSNQAGEETGSTTAPGIDLTGSAHGANLEIRTAGDGAITLETGTGSAAGPEAAIRAGVLTTSGANVTLTTEDGSISLARANTSGADGATGADAGDIRLDAGDEDGSGDTTLLVTGNLTARGGNGTTGSGGAGGFVGARTPATGGGGSVTLMGDVDSSGGDGVGGGDGGSVFVGAAVQGDVSTGDITSRGGNAFAPTLAGRGGHGGPVEISTGDGDIAVGAIDSRGGDADGNQTESGGNGGGVTIFAGKDDAGAGSLTLNGNLTLLGGDGSEGRDGLGGPAQLRAKGDIEHAGQAGPHIATQGDVIFNGANVGALAPIVVSGGGTPEGLLGLGADGVARVEIDEGSFDDLQIAAFSPTADVQLVEGAAPIVHLQSGEVVLADTSAHGADLTLAFQDRLEGEDDDPTPLQFRVRTGSITGGGNVRLISEDDLLIGDSAGTAIEMRALPPDPNDPGAPSVSGALILVADSDRDDSGAVLDGVAGPDAGLLDLVGDADEAGGLIVPTGEGIGASGDPIAIVGGAPVALVTTSGGIFLRNQGSGALTVSALSVQAKQQNQSVALSGVSVRDGAGDVALENAAGDLVLEESVSTSGDANKVGGAVTLTAAPGSSVVLALPPGHVAVDANGPLSFAGDVTLMEDSQVVSQQGDVFFGGAIDTDAARGDRVRSLLVQARLPDPGATVPVTAGAIHLAGDVGVANDVRDLTFNGDVVLDGGARRIDTTNHLFFLRDVRASADDAAGLSILAGPRVELLGNVGVGGRLSSFSIARNDDPPFVQELPDPFVLFGGEGEQKVLTGAGGIVIVLDGLTEIPDRAMIAKLGGDLSLESVGGGVNLGPNEKLTVQGIVNLKGDTVQLGDVSALELHVDSPDARLRARAAGPVLTRSGGRAKDGGMDLIANAVGFTSAPTIEGTGPAPRIATPSGTADNAGPLEVLAFNGTIEAGNLVSGSTVLDLAIRPQDLPNEEPHRGPLVTGLVEPRASDAAAAGSALPPGAEDVLAYLRCSAEQREGCFAPPASPLDSPRGSQLASESARLLGDSRSARELREGLARLDPPALRRLAVFLTEIRLLGLSDSEYRSVRDALYRDILADRGPAAPEPGAFATAVKAQARGVPL